LSKPNKKKILNPETVAVLDSMSLRARLIVEGYIIGQHRSPFHGYSVEFAEHRSYEPGDEVRHIDWKLFAKTDRLFVKRFEEETNLSAHIILDISKSMTYESNNITKLNYANSLTAALCYLMIKQQDAVGLIKFSNVINTFIPSNSKPSHLKIIFDNLSDDQTGNDTKIESILHEIAERISKRGLIVLISDLLDNPDNIINGLKHFRHNKQEIIVFHIFDREEIDFNYSNPTKFIDMETSEEIITEPWHIRSNYKDMLNEHQALFKKKCHENLIDYLPIITDQNLDLCLAEYLKKRKKLN
tara:strand:- start:31 stop:930 length:900 start_codon:yes stop_codon:yes gene_type:complete